MIHKNEPLPKEKENGSLDDLAEVVFGLSFHFDDVHFNLMLFANRVKYSYLS